MQSTQLFKDDLSVRFEWKDRTGPVMVTHIEDFGGVESPFQPQKFRRDTARSLWKRLKKAGYK